MTVLDQITVPRAAEVQTEASTVLLSSIGLSKAAFFARDHLTRQTDYITFKEQVFGSETVDSLVSQIEIERNG
jgi:hypothetical protein